MSESATEVTTGGKPAVCFAQPKAYPSSCPVELEYAVSSTCIMKFAPNVAENSGARFRAPTVREGLAASTRLIR